MGRLDGLDGLDGSIMGWLDGVISFWEWGVMGWLIAMNCVNIALS